MSHLVSIVIPVFNRRHLIEDTLQSALAQTYENVEVVVVDNASTDGTWEVLQAAATADSRLRVYRNPTNIGPVRNWRAGIDKAAGTYLKILWSDDLLHENCLAELVPLLTDESVGFAFSAVTFFNDDKPGSSSTHYRYLPPGLHAAEKFVEGALLSRDLPVSPGCVLLRTADARANLRVDIPNSIGSDFASHAIGNDLLLLLLTANGYDKVAVADRPLSFFRAHRSSISTESTPSRLFIHYSIVKAYFAQTYLDNEPLRRRLNSQLAFERSRFGAGADAIMPLHAFYPKPQRQRFDLVHSIKLRSRVLVSGLTSRLRFK